jgi:hypothetical protein
MVPLIPSNVPDAVPYIQYIAANEQTVYPYPFPITQDSDLVVVINLYLIAQQLEASIAQSLQVPNTNSPLPTTTLTPGAYATKYLSFDSNGNQTPAVLTSSGTSTAQIIGGSIYPQSLAEKNAGVTPTNVSYPCGSFQRYGMDPTGTNDSSGGLAAAIASNDYVYDSYPGGGNYVFNSTVAITNYPLHIHGTGKNAAGPSAGTSGTRFTLKSGAGSNAALLHWTAFAADVEIDGISFGWQSVTTGQIAILFDADCRSTRIHNNTFFGGVNASTNVTGVKLAGGGTFSGDVTIEKNYGTALQTGIYLGATCSTVRVLDNELYSNPTITGSIGLNNQSTVGGVIAESNTFEQWNKGIYSPHGNIRQITNYFEGSIIFDFDWGRSHNNLSVGDISTGTPLANFAINNATGNIVLGGSYGYTADSTTTSAYRGFVEQNRTVANGHQITRAFAAGNYSGSGSMSWTVTAREVGGDMLVVNGNEATYYFEVTASSVGGTPATALTINLAAFGVTPAMDSFEACSITDNGGRPAMGMARAVASSQTLLIYKDATFATNWSASTTSTTVRGHIKFPINFSVN